MRHKEIFTPTRAFHNLSERYDPPRCHPSTRIAVLQHIMTWINDLQKLYLFMWLYGPAGAGKSAIAQSIAELCHGANLLAASLSMPAIRENVENVIEQD